MRKYHRWITVFFGVFMLFMAVTGVASHIAAMVARGSVFEVEKKEAPAAPTAPTVQATAGTAPAAAGPAAAPAPAPTEAKAPAPASSARAWVGFFHHLHSGETFGPVGTIISLLSGFALIFFAFSGMWMYLQMFMHRKKIGRGKLFWK